MTEWVFLADPGVYVPISAQGENFKWDPDKIELWYLYPYMDMECRSHMRDSVCVYSMIIIVYIWIKHVNK